VATTTTDATGHFSLSYTPAASRRYWVTTNQISKIEIPTPTLDPPFGDVLAPASTPESGPVSVLGRVAVANLTAGKGKVSGKVTLQPTVRLHQAQLQLWAARVQTPARPLRFIAQLPISQGASTKSFTFFLGKGTWRLQLRYTNPNVITAGTTGVHTRTVG
jgi:hypothetical protein